MSGRKLLCQVGFGIVMALIISLISSATVQAQECRVVWIHGLEVHKSVAVEPETMRISKDTCVVWYNRATAMNVKITFQEGKACASATDGGAAFKMGYGACYVSSWIPFAGTSSLRFKEKGTYKYVIETANGPENLPERGEKIAEGTIMVSE